MIDRFEVGKWYIYKGRVLSNWNKDKRKIVDNLPHLCTFVWHSHSCSFSDVYDGTYTENCQSQLSWFNWSDGIDDFEEVSCLEITKDFIKDVLEE